MMQRSFRRVLPTGLKYGLRPAATGFSSESYTDKQEKTGRPLSPHVDIYKFPPAAVTSVAIRITGAALSGGLTFAAALALVGADVPALASSLGSVSGVGEVAKFSVAFPIVYHYMGALRHLYWDSNPEALETDKVTNLSYIFGGSAFVVSAGLAMVTLAPL